MNTRRKFLLQGSMATTAMLVAKPFTSIANSLAPVTGYSINNNKLVLVHTGDHTNVNDHQTIQHITSLKNNTGNLMVLHAGHIDGKPAIQLKYDASILAGDRFSVSEGDYKIIYKGDIKTGVITAVDSQTASVSHINTIAAYLKNEKNCHIVICLSQLGYKAKNALNDLTLARESTHIDVIIGGHAKDFCKHPFTTLNKNAEEVIIHHAADNALALRKIEIDFDDQGKKKQLAFPRIVPSKWQA